MVKFPKCKDKCAAVNPACSTINLAKEGHSLEERKTKLLVFEKDRYHPINKPKPECQLPVGITITPNTAKKIRICTAEDIRTTCPPPCCNCPRMKPKMTVGQMIKYGIKFGFKTAVLVGVVYTSWDLGLWGTADETENIWNSMKKFALGPDVPEGAPCLGRKIYGAKEKWNNAINKSFLNIACIGRSVQAFIYPVDKKNCDPDQQNIDDKEKAKKDPCSCK